jgi:hypothetical protein
MGNNTWQQWTWDNLQLRPIAELDTFTANASGRRHHSCVIDAMTTPNMVFLGFAWQNETGVVVGVLY